MPTAAAEQADDLEKGDKLGDKFAKLDLAAIRKQSVGIFDRNEVLSCGNFWLDYVSGNQDGLFPKAAITELAALKGAGKTTLCLETIAYNQHLAEINKKPFRVLYMDWEKNLVYQQDLARAIGVDPGDPNFFYRQPNTLEGGAQFVLECLKGHTRKKWLGIDAPLDMIVIDTLAAARAKCEIDNKLGGTAKPGYRGKLWAEFFRNAQADLDTAGPAIVVINHMQVKLDLSGGSYGPPQYDTPGSNALKLYAAQRYMLRELEGARLMREIEDPYTYEVTKQTRGIVVEILCEKSKIGSPYRKSSYVITPGIGIDDVVTMFLAAERKPGSIYIGGKNAQFGVPHKLHADEEQVKASCKKLVMGRFNFMDHLRSNFQDSKQLATNLNELWVAQIDVNNQISERRTRLLATATPIDEAKAVFNEEELTAHIADTADI